MLGKGVTHRDDASQPQRNELSPGTGPAGKVFMMAKQMDMA
jgi:hypothetical protein